MKNLIVTIILFFACNTFAQEFSFSGYGATGFRFTSKNMLNGYNQETYYEGKFQADIEINNKIDAQIDFRGNSQENEVVMKEFSVKFKFWKHFRLKIGNIKKPFGYEQLINREKLLTTDRTFLHNNISEVGFGGREFSIMGYYKYSEKKPEFPYSYYISFSKDNSLAFSGNARFIYHKNNFSYGVSYMYFNQGGDQTIGVHGFSVDLSKKEKKYTTAVELVYLKDPVENLRRRLQNREEDVYTYGAKLFGSYEFDVDSDILKKIEPIAVLSLYVPDSNEADTHTLQAVIGANFYIHKKVSIRLQGDLRLTKNQYNEDYNTKNSLGIMEVLVRF